MWLWQPNGIHCFPRRVEPVDPAGMAGPIRRRPEWTRGGFPVLRRGPLGATADWNAALATGNVLPGVVRPAILLATAGLARDVASRAPGPAGSASRLCPLLMTAFFDGFQQQWAGKDIADVRGK